MCALSFFASHSQRFVKRSGRVIALAVVLVIAQFGVAGHSLHLDEKQGQKAEVTCAFCIAGFDFGAAPVLPVVHGQRIARSILVSRFLHVREAFALVTSQLIRGPPLSID
jgi:hypothetical protein